MQPPSHMTFCETNSGYLCCNANALSVSQQERNGSQKNLMALQQ